MAAEAQQSSAGEQGHSNEAIQAEQLLAAQAYLDERKPMKALGVLDKLIESFEAKNSESKDRLYSARTPPETLFYLVTAVAQEQRDASVLGPTWTLAYYMKAYALMELGRLTDARRALERARVLSPKNSLVLSELAYTYQSEQRWEDAVELYEESADAATNFSPDESRTQEEGRALRGQGFSLTELGQLEQAEAAYLRCLEINPNDEDAKRELAFIAQLRAKTSQ